MPDECCAIVRDCARLRIVIRTLLTIKTCEAERRQGLGEKNLDDAAWPTRRQPTESPKLLPLQGIAASGRPRMHDRRREVPGHKRAGVGEPDLGEADADYQRRDDVQAEA